MQLLKPIERQLTNSTSSENLMEDALPRWPALLLLTVSVDDLPVDLSTSVVEIDVSKFDWTLALPDPPTDPKDENDWDGEPCVEELLSCGETTLRWGDCREQLRGTLVMVAFT